MTTEPLPKQGATRSLTSTLLGGQGVNCSFHADVFLHGPRRSRILQARLAEIAAHDAVGVGIVVQEAWEKNQGQQCTGVSWDTFDAAVLASIAAGLGGAALAKICRLFAQDYGHRRAGVPDCILWRPIGRTFIPPPPSPPPSPSPSPSPSSSPSPSANHAEDGEEVTAAQSGRSGGSEGSGDAGHTGAVAASAASAADVIAVAAGGAVGTVVLESVVGSGSGSGSGGGARANINGSEIPGGNARSKSDGTAAAVAGGGGGGAASSTAADEVHKQEPMECMFVEVKSPNDRLSEKQLVWLHVLQSFGVQAAVCNVVHCGGDEEVADFP